MVLRFTDDVSESPASPDISSLHEDALVGIRIGGEAELRITERDPRCRMVTLDPQTAEADPRLMKYLDRQHGGRLGVYAATSAPGRVRVGDPVWLLPPR